MGAYLSLDELVRLANICVVASIKKDELLPEAPFYLILKGHVGVSTPEGEVLVEKHEGSFFTRRAGLVAPPPPTLKEKMATAITLPTQLKELEKNIQSGVMNGVGFVERGVNNAATYIKRGSTVSIARASLFPTAHAQHRASIWRGTAMPKDLIDGAPAASDGPPVTKIVAKTNCRFIYVPAGKLDPFIIRRAALAQPAGGGSECHLCAPLTPRANSHRFPPAHSTRAPAQPE